MNRYRNVLIPAPLIAPLGIECTAPMVQDVWDVFVKPEQDAGGPQSGEMRVLMAILRSVHEGLRIAEAAGDTVPADPPCVCPCHRGAWRHNNIAPVDSCCLQSNTITADPPQAQP